MEADDTEALHPVAADIAADMTLTSGRIALPDERMAHWSAKLAELPVREHDDVLVALIALASRFAREAAEASAPARGQLMALAAVLLSPDDAEELFAKMGLVDRNQHAHVTGAGKVSNRPVSDAKASGSSVIGLRLSRGSKKSR